MANANKPSLAYWLAGCKAYGSTSGFDHDIIRENGPTLFQSFLVCAVNTSTVKIAYVSLCFRCFLLLSGML